MKTLVALLALVSISAQQVPSRDLPAVVPTSGTATVSGIVVNDATPPQPVRRAIVTLSGGGLVPSRSVVTDDEGRFSVTGLPEGRFIVTVRRSGFITSSYGAKRPGRPGTALAVAAGAHIPDVHVRIWRGAAIEGVVRDEFGRPAAGVTMFAMPARRITGAALTLNNDGAITDDRGRFRLFGLEPGTYAVAARPGGTVGAPLLARTDAEVDAIFARLTGGGGAARPAAGQESSAAPTTFAPIYYPGTADIGSAQPITLAPGQLVEGLDFTLQRVAASVVEGQLLRADGTPARGATVQLALQAAQSRFPFDEPVVFDTTADQDGRFRLGSIAPGVYQLIARGPAAEPPKVDTGGVVLSQPGGAAVNHWATMPVTVVGGDLTGLNLTLAPGRTVRGRVEFTGSEKPPASMQQIRMNLIPSGGVDRQGVVRTIAFTIGGAISPDGSFEITSVPPGRFRLSFFGAPIASGPWFPHSAMIGGVDTFDGLVDFNALPDGELVVTFSDNPGELSGTLSTQDGAPVSDVFVIAYSANNAHWGPQARRVQAVRPGVDGRYHIARLPAGEYFLAAVTDVDQDEWQDPAFLAELIPASIKVALTDGEKKTQDIRLSGG